MTLTDAGYFAKALEGRPECLRVEGVREIGSVSHCISKPPEGWIDAWRHNGLGWYNSVEDAWSVVPERDRARYRLFAYRLGDTRYRKGEPLSVSIPSDVRPSPIPSSFVTLGYDAVSNSGFGFECSPLSCNYMAGEIPVNAFCLLDSEAEAAAVAKAFSVEEPEPGDYYAVEVLLAPHSE